MEEYIQKRECPFCGSIEHRTMRVQDSWTEDNYWRVVCRICDALGSVAKSEEMAVKKWNGILKNTKSIEKFNQILIEDMSGTGGVSTPMATLANVPGMGNAVPAAKASGQSIGSGDRWDNVINKKPYTQAAKKKKKKTTVKENNINPYDKIAMMMAKKMKVKPPFKAINARTNQVKQQKFESTKILSLDEFMNSINEETVGQKDSLKYINAKKELEKMGVPFVFKVLDEVHQLAFIKEPIEEVKKKLKISGWEESETQFETTGKIEMFKKDNKLFSIFSGEFDHPYATLIEL